jgi:hypothetical protein
LIETAAGLRGLLLEKVPLLGLLGEKQEFLADGVDISSRDSPETFPYSSGGFR